MKFSVKYFPVILACLVIGCLLLCSLAGDASAITKEELLIEAQKIKAALPPASENAVAPTFAALPDQEELVYKATFFALPIGKFIITNHGKESLGDREVYHFELTVKTLPFFSILWKTKDRYVSYMDVQERVVVRREEYIKGGTVLESVVDFNYEEGTATNKNPLTGHEETVPIPGKVLDILSGGFYLRMMPLALGDTVDLNIFADNKIYTYTGLLAEETKVRMPHVGKQDAYRFKPYLFLEGEQVKKISAEIFFSTTSPRTPLRSTLQTRLGKVQVVLVDKD